jgi:hypothetical protein
MLTTSSEHGEPSLWIRGDGRQKQQRRFDYEIQVFTGHRDPGINCVKGGQKVQRVAGTGCGEVVLTSRVHSNSVRHQLVQGLFDAPSEFITAGDDFHAEIVEAFTCHFHRCVFEMVGTSHLRSQVRTTAFDSFEFGVELSAHRDLALNSARETPAKHP